MAGFGWWRGLLARLTLAYAVGALLLTSIVALASFTIAQNRLLETERSNAREQFHRNALQVRTELASIPSNATRDERLNAHSQLSDRLRRPNGSSSLLIPPGGLPPVGSIVENTIPSLFRSEVLDLRIADYFYRGQTEVGETPNYIVGVYMEDLDAKYYEVLSLAELENTTSSLRQILLATAIVAGLAGAALGYYAARRVLAPVFRVSNAAQAIAEGDFKTRLDLSADPDLEVLSRSFNDMVDALEVRIRRDERFASDVSHELRSPLMTLTASVEVLERRRGSLPEVAQRAVDLLRQDLTRFERLVEDLLEISRMDAGAVQLQTSPFRLNEFLINVIAQSRSPEIELSHPHKDRDLVISADKRRLAQVMTNLIDNATKYADGATAIRYRRVGEQVLIMVEDDGPGVPSSDRDRIFDRFSRAGSDAGRRARDTGVGLGLSLVAEHVRLHGGRVWVTDRTDGQSGARFVVELPLGVHADEGEEMAV
ncbi:MAG: HAMP domain-containing histidine kinase [Acidimicrobiia bacterium]|nr:HAMP domain-containing histidine kinase [Acidimicrobiia bacterium]